MDKLEMAQRCKDVLWKSDEASRALGIKITVAEAGAATAIMKTSILVR